ncbi:hypothetical protein [Arthrobacter sp. M2012083]|uniref:hypothetical protein n=1 Tax=Arthrobacter sp. M2012083 TaxID=1197706 RepID=UPI000378B55C|nr:hypothetical protein [Arthrobacter sp. M2012083]
MNLDVVGILNLVAVLCLLAVPVTGLLAGGVYLWYLVRRLTSPDRWFVPASVVGDFQFLGTAPSKLSPSEKVILSNAYIRVPVQLIRATVFLLFFSLGSDLAAQLVSVQDPTLNSLGAGLMGAFLLAMVATWGCAWSEKRLSAARALGPGVNLSRAAKKFIARDNANHRRLLSLEGRRFLTFAKKAGVPDIDPRLVQIAMFLENPTLENVRCIPATVHLTLKDVVAERFSRSSWQLSRVGKGVVLATPTVGVVATITNQLVQLINRS